MVEPNGEATKSGEAAAQWGRVLSHRERVVHYTSKQSTGTAM